jgi:hypothetical protein
MKYILILALLFTFTACKDWGTEGGNPETTHNGSTPAIAAEYLSTIICGKRETCTGQADQTCFSQLATQPQMTTELRMNSYFNTLSELYSATNVEIADNKMLECTTEIRNLDCNSTLAQDAFDPSSYADIHLSLRASTSCGDIFSIKN